MKKTVRGRKKKMKERMVGGEREERERRERGRRGGRRGKGKGGGGRRG